MRAGCGCGGSTAGGSGATIFAGPQPWTVDVSSAEKSDRSDAIIGTLGAEGGWGTDNMLQVDFSIPVFFADSSTTRSEVIGTDDYCYGGNACDSVPAQLPVPDGANIEGSSDLTCDPSGDTEGQSDCHLLVVDRDERKLYETYNTTESDAPPYGVRLRLRAGFDDSGFGDAQKVVIRALKKHGMLLSDGGTVPLTFADDRTSQAKWADLGIDAQSFSSLDVEEFEVVELGEEIPLTYDCLLN